MIFHGLFLLLRFVSSLFRERTASSLSSARVAMKL
jgi:hypothetical protein